jgi:hypothetical protein
MDTHIINKERKMILEEGGLQKEINKYLKALQISQERGEEEVNKIIDRLEELSGVELTDEEKKLAIAGKLDSLKDTFVSLSIKGTTIFFWDTKTNKPCIGDHMIYGFLKAAAIAISRTLPEKKGTVLNSASYTQSLINQHVRCEEQFLVFDKDIKRLENGEINCFQRSLRAMTAKGPRVSLAKSEVIEAGASVNFTLKVIKNSEVTQNVLEKLFSYGELSGIGQWRNAGYGQFKFEMTKIV